MSHHWDEQSGSLSRAREDALKSLVDNFVGLRNERFPHGQIDPADKGQFRYSVKANTIAQIVRVEFNGPVTAIGFTLEETEQLIESLNEARMALRGITV